jgi:protein TonB
MRKSLAFVASAAVAALSTPAAARDHSGYIGADFGLLWAKDAHVDIVDPDFAEDDFIVIDHKTGYDVDVNAGYDFGMFRVEGEIAYKRAKHSDYQFDVEDDGGFPSDQVDGRTSVLSGMVNALLDLGNDRTGFTVGGGIGIASTKLRVNSEIDNFDNDLKDSHFAWQLLAGVHTAVSSNIDVGVKYRYFDAGRMRDDGQYGIFLGDLQTHIKTHSLLLGLTYNFAGAAPPPPPPPPPPAAAPVKVVKQIQTDIVNGELRTPTKIPNKVKIIKEDEAPPPVMASAGVVGGVPGGVPGGSMGGVMGSILSSTPTVAPKIATPQRVRVSSGVSTGMLVRKVPPSYPPLARQARIQGTVILQATISKEGSIENLQLISGHPMLAPAAIEAVKQWKYKPYLLNGEPVEVETQVQVNFTLAGG